MKKIVAIWDIHWMDIWEKIVERGKDTDKIIFVWDYFDSFNLSAPIQIENFKKILDFQKENKDKVEILLWNHEYNYLVNWMDNTSWYNSEYSDEINSLLIENIKSLKIVIKINNILFSHAWFSQTWINRLNHFNLDLENDFEQEMNELFFSTYDNNNPVFNFYKYDFSWIWNSINQWPLWVRPESLDNNFFGNYNQVVWHSYVDKENRLKFKEKWIHFIDNLVTNIWDENNEKKYYLKITEEENKYIFKEELI